MKIISKKPMVVDLTPLEAHLNELFHTELDRGHGVVEAANLAFNTMHVQVNQMPRFYAYLVG